MVDAAGPEEARTGLVADALRHHLRLIAVCALLGLALGYAAGMALSSNFTSKATVLVNPLVGNPYSPEGSGDSLTNLETEAQLVQSDVLVNKVAIDTGVDRQALLTNLTTSVPVNTQIVEISFTSANAKTAAVVVNAFAKDYLAARQARRDAVVSGQASNLAQQISDTQKKLRKAANKGSIGNTFQTKLAQTLTDQLASLRIQAAQVSASGRNPGLVITPGVVPSSHGGISPRLLLVSGLILGIIVGALLALSRERSSQVLRHLEQVEQAGLPVLGVFTGQRNENRAAVYRHVRAALGARPDGALVAAGVSGDVAAGVVAAELAESYTNSPQDVALVDAVGTASRILSPAETHSVLGLSDVLLGDASLDQTLIPLLSEESATIHLLPPGNNPEAGAERYASESMTQLISTLRSRCGLVLLASPGLSEPDGSALAVQADAVLMVVALNQTTYSGIMAAREWLERSGTALAGALVITELSRRSPFSSGVVQSTTSSPPPRPAAAQLPETGAQSGGATAIGDSAMSRGREPAGSAQAEQSVEAPDRGDTWDTRGQQAPSAQHE